MEIVIYDKDTKHNKMVKDICFRFTFRENIDCEIHVFEMEKEMKAYMEQSQLQKLIMAGIKGFEKDFTLGDLKNHFIILMGNSAGDLMQAVTPGFRPAGLLLKPVEKKLLEQLLFEVKKECEIEKKNKEMFFFRMKTQEYFVPKDRILFFESRNKKIVLRTDSQEMEFYDTLENLKNRLGKDFVRVHKSFLVNLSRVTMMHFSNKTVHFEDGTFVPISRTYKAEAAAQWNRRKETL